MELFKNWNFKRHVLSSLLISLIAGIVIFLSRRIAGSYLTGVGSASSNGGFSISFTSLTYSAISTLIIFIVLVVLYKPAYSLINKFIEKN